MARGFGHRPVSRVGPGPPTVRRVAVIGATGCMGRQIASAFAARGTEVVAIARRYTSHVAAHRFLALDAAHTSSEQLAQLLAEERVGAVVNATLGWGDELHATNVQLTERLVDALRRTPGSPRLVHLGTIHEYGPVPRGTSIDEKVPPHPQQPYPVSKLIAARLVLDAARAGDLDGVVLRLTNTIGPHPAAESFFGSLAARLRDDRDTIDLTIAEAHRDYVDSRDAADAVVRAAESPSAHGVFNIGTGRALDIRTLVAALVRAAGRPPESVRGHLGAIRSRGADWIRVDGARAQRLLGWSPLYSLDASMRALWETVRTESPDRPP
ncbi:NAD-dependent epimerase/dehydratase family protein [Streptomyces sp. NBC_00258]|uniref:NAD-dependent epimerase/dehydratase family protein n=1 Tax=Streptomyces sp. NBC_00258 TaxID=2903642 RepID=UPI002E2BA4C9|nr:NAD(P)-dependent oxidoreductase [Streptomyces sp. NBC_00258]